MFALTKQNQIPSIIPQILQSPQNTGDVISIVYSTRYLHYKPRIMLKRVTGHLSHYREMGCWEMPSDVHCNASWDKCKNPCSLRNCIIPNSANARGRRPRQSSHWELCDFSMGIRVLALFPWGVILWIYHGEHRTQKVKQASDRLVYRQKFPCYFGIWPYWRRVNWKINMTNWEIPCRFVQEKKRLVITSNIILP